MKLVHTPHDVLTTPARPVTVFNATLRKTLQDMTRTLIEHKNPEGVGLAAPQVGLDQRMFLIRPSKKDPVTAYINPEIVDIDPVNTADISEDKNHFEGCLSIPYLWGPVHRSETLTLAWQDEHGKHHKQEFSGFKATIIQHEMDHLNGILFTQRIVEQGGTLYREVGDELEPFEI